VILRPRLGGAARGGRVEVVGQATGPELRVQHFLHSLGAHRQFHAPRQLDENFLVRPALADLHHLLLREHHVRRNGGESRDLVELGPRRRGQHDIGEFRRRRHEQIGAHHEVELHE